MEEVSQRKAITALIRQAMPKVAELMADKRTEVGDAHCVTCQQRGMAGEPGWFYAWESGLSIGTPWPEALEVLALVDPRNEIRTKAVVALRPVGKTDGAA